MDKYIVVTSVAMGRFLGIVGVFSSMANVVEGIQAYEEKHLGKEDSQRTRSFAPQAYHTPFGHRGEMHYIPGVMSTFILTMDVVTNHAVGVPLLDPNTPGYTMKE